MTLVKTRVLIIIRQVQLAADLKQSLERTGDFEASAFTTVEAAVDALQTRPHHVALVDFSNSSQPPVDVVLQLRAVQPDIAIIASPDMPVVRGLVRDMQLQGLADLPCSLRELIPVIQGAAQDAIDALPDTAAAPAVRVESDTSDMTDLPESPPAAPDFSSLDSVLVKMGGLDVLGSDTLDMDTGETVLGESGEQSSVVEFVLNGSASRLVDDDDDAGDDVHDGDDDREPAFERLAAAEPPPPSLEDSGTIRDLRTGVNHANLNQVVQVIQKRPLPLPPIPAEDDDEAEPDQAPGEAVTPPESRPNTAASILRTALGDATARPMGLDELLDTLSRQFPDDTGGVKPLPSWVEQAHRYVDEPDFLQEPLPPPEVDFAPEDDASIEVTRPGAALQAEIEDQPHDMETEYLPGEPQSSHEPEIDDEVMAAHPPDESVTFPADSEALTGAATESVTAPHSPQPDMPAEPAEPPAGTSGPPPSEPRPPRRIAMPSGEPPITLGTDDPDPKIAQLALGLTQFSLESTVQACLLARGGEVIAYAGSLPLEDIDAIQQIVGHDWEAQSVQSRIRFITPPSGDREFMLYSRRTDAGFSLSMVFTAETHLRAIRRQARMLLDALNSVQERFAERTAIEDDPELEQLERLAVDEEQAALDDTAAIRALTGAPPAATLDEALQPVKTVTLAPCTFLWMLADPDQTLTQDVARAIVADLDRELANQGWHVEQIQVYEDFVYLMADVPADRSAHEIVRELKQQSARIAGQTNPELPVDSLWGDNYGVLTPGRELDVEEMQRFVNFVRLQ